ncbi:hypothetical protein Tco_0260346 [Tanacetum coccineum]
MTSISKRCECCKLPKEGFPESLPNMKKLELKFDCNLMVVMEDDEEQCQWGNMMNNFMKENDDDNGKKMMMRITELETKSGRR